MRSRVNTPARPVTIAASFPSVTSAPNLITLKSPEQKTTTRSVAPRPRMPEPPSELPGELVNVIHVPSPTPATPPYMNVPTRDVPEYVDMTEYDELPEETPRPQYVNVPLDPGGRREYFGFVVIFIYFQSTHIHAEFFPRLVSLNLTNPFQSHCRSLDQPEGPPERLRRGDSTPAYPSPLTQPTPLTLPSLSTALHHVASALSPCPVASPPSPRPPRLSSRPPACLRRGLFLLPSPPRGPPPPPPVRTRPTPPLPVVVPLPPKCQLPQRTSKATGGSCPPRSRGEPHVLRRGQAVSDSG